MENTKSTPALSGSNIKDFEQKLKIIEEKNSVNTSGSFSHEQMMKALYYVWDAFDRSTITFFLIGKTAQACVKNLGLTGDKIEIGMRYNERHSGAWRILTEFAPVVRETEDTIYFEHQGVPIECKVFQEDIYFDSPSPQLWQYEAFNIPNPYKDYVAKYETKAVQYQQQT